ncbi:MAG: hypothetical protein J1F09_04975 [Oscillospiraceae bacterium]|nr:hypothetical protein [Oscillospiraceae bacterium]
MADKIKETLEKLATLSQQEKQLFTDMEAAFKEYNDYCSSSDVDLKEKIDEINEKIGKLDYYIDYAKEHAQASELEEAPEAFETPEGTLESIRQTIKLDSRNDVNAETLYTKATGMKKFYEEKIENTRKLIEGSKVQAKRQYDSDVASLNDRKEQHDAQVKEYIASEDFKDYLKLLSFDKAAFNSTGTANLTEKSFVSLGQRRAKLTVPMEIEQELSLSSNGEYNSAAHTIGAPIHVSMENGSVLYLDFDEKNKQYLFGGIQRLLLNITKYFGQDITDILFCEPQTNDPECLGHIAALSRGEDPLITFPTSAEEAEGKLLEICSKIEGHPTPDKVTRVVVLHGFPENYGFSVKDRVLNMCKKASENGVIVVLTHDSAAAESDLEKEIRELALSVRSRNGGFWIEKYRESFFWYSAPSDLPEDVRRTYVEQRRQQAAPAPEPAPTPAPVAEPDAPETPETPETPEPTPTPAPVPPVSENEPEEEMVPMPEPKAEEPEEEMVPMSEPEAEAEPEEEMLPMPEPEAEAEPEEEMLPMPEPEAEEEPEEEMLPMPEPEAEAEPEEEMLPMPEPEAEAEPEEEMLPMPEPEAEAEPEEEMLPMPEPEAEEEPEEEMVPMPEPEPEPEPIPAPVTQVRRVEPLPPKEPKPFSVSVVSELHETLPPPEPEPTPEPVAEPVTKEPEVPKTEEKATEAQKPETNAAEVPQKQETSGKGKRTLPSVEIGKDVEDVPKSLDIGGNITYICGKRGDERTRLSDMIIAKIAADTHPDDAELWIFDCGDGELLKYADDPAAHIKYLVSDNSAETSFDLTDILDGELARRIAVFKENGWKKFKAVPADAYLPNIVVVINEFPRFRENIANGPKYFGRNYSEKLNRIFKNCGDYGIHFILFGEFFSDNGARPDCFKNCAVHSAAAVACHDAGVREMFGDIKLYENEIESLKKVPAGCAFIAEENSTNGLTLVRFVGKPAEIKARYTVVSEYSDDADCYVDKCPIIADKKSQSTYAQHADERERIISERDPDETLLFLGDPCRFASEYPVRIFNSFGENLLMIAPAHEKKNAVSVIIAAVSSLCEQGVPVEILAFKTNPVYAELMRAGGADGITVFEDDAAVKRVKELSAEIAEGKSDNTFEIVLGGDLLIAAMHAEDSSGDLRRALVKGPGLGVHFIFAALGAAQMASGFTALFRHRAVFACAYTDAEKVLRDPNCGLPENAFRLSNDSDELTMVPYII